MDAQFISIKAYKLSDVPRIVKEAMRVQSHCRHVPEPTQPNTLFSKKLGLDRAVKFLKALCAKSAQMTGRKVRKDLLIFAAGTCSYPKTPMLIEKDPQERAKYEQWKQLSINHLKKEHGDDLFCVLEHTDERYLHLHYFCMPRLMPDGRINLVAHPGRTANIENQNEPPAVKRSAYKEAMRRYLDRYYKFVGFLMGWARKTQTPRKRVSKKQWEDTLKQVSDQKILKMLGYGHLIAVFDPLEDKDISTVLEPKKTTKNPQFRPKF